MEYKYSEHYEQLSQERLPFLDRARECSEYTLPLIIRPSEGDDSNTDYETKYQSVGSRGVTNLSSQLLLSLFPTTTPFFKLYVSDADLAIFGENKDKIEAEIEESLRDIEKTVLEELEQKNIRVSIYEALKNLLISGNALVYVEEDGNLRVYSLENYVVHRDISGNLTDIVITEHISQKILKASGMELPSDMSMDEVDPSNRKNICLQTHIHLNDEDEFDVFQTIEDQKLPDSETTYTKDKLPYLALRLTRVTGESYGRSYVEGVIGDLKSLEALSKALVEAAAISAKTLFLVNPASVTRAKNIASARNGDVIPGNVSDVGVLRTDKASDLTTAYNAMSAIEKRLSYAFNLLEAAMPTSPAVTATEIRSIVESLERVMAGVYAMLSGEFILPLVRLVIDKLGQENKITQLPSQVKVLISTGLTALGRTSDLERTAQFVQMAKSTMPESFMRYVDEKKILEAMANSIGVEFIKSDEQLMAEEQAALEQQQAMIQQQEELADNQVRRQTMGKVAEKAVPEAMNEEELPQE